MIINPFVFAAGGGGGPPLTLIPGFSYTAFYSIALRNAAYTGPCCRVIRASDSATLDIPFGSDGWMDEPTITGFISGADLFVDRWYDQSGNAHHIESNTSGKRPKLANSGGSINKLSTRPAMTYDGSDDGFTHAADAAFGFGTSDFTVETFAHANPSWDMTDNTILDMRTGSGQDGVFLVDSAKKMTYFNGSSLTASTAVADATTVHMAWAKASGTLRQFRNGTVDGSTSGTTNFGATRPLWVGTKFIPSDSIIGYLLELGIVTGAASWTANFTPRSMF